MNQDLEHIKILSIFHYVVAGLAALFASFPIIHLVIGISMLSGNFFGETVPSSEEFDLFGLFFTVIPAAMILLGWAFAIALVFAGRNLARKQRYTFCLIMAGINCMFMPFGTVLGVFTIIVLMRPSVKELFGVNHSEAQKQIT